MSLKPWSPEFEERLLASKNYRDFLSAFFQKNCSWDSPKALTFQEFALRSGFASKSFLHDVIAGRKRLTPSSLPAVTIGLRLTKPWMEYFEALIGQEELCFQNKVHSQQYFQNRLQALKTKFLKRQSHQKFVATSPVVKVFLSPYCPDIYAGLGSVEEGANLQDLLKRTRIPQIILKDVLAQMIEVGLVLQVSDRYLPLVSALSVSEMHSHEVFERDFFRSWDKVKKRFPNQAKSSESLFMTQTFSASSERLEKLKRDLAKLLADFTADAEASEGDCIAEFTIGFTNNQK